MAVRRPRHFGRSARVASNLGFGTAIIKFNVSMIIPKKGSLVAGPMTLSSAVGMLMIIAPWNALLEGHFRTLFAKIIEKQPLQYTL